MKVLAIGAHPDDYEIGAGMRLMHHAKMHDDVIGVICSNGEKGGDEQIRMKEAIKAAEFIGMKQLYMLSFTDTQFPDITTMKNHLEEIIVKEEPAIVYSHSPDDRHQDHKATAMAAAIACRKVLNILMYQSPSTILSSFQPHLFHVGSEIDMEEKQQMLKIYQSQIERESGVQIEQVRLMSTFYGSYINRYSREPIYAEPFLANHMILNFRDM